MTRVYTPAQPRVTTQCLRCSVPISVMASKVRKGAGKFCSRACGYQYRSDAARAHPQTSQVERTCEECGGTFLAHACYVRKGGARFCTRQCSAAAKREPLEERFWKRVDRSSDCWEWTGPLMWNGYGTMPVKAANGWRPVPAHRVAWGITHGSIPDGLHVCHHCDNRRCVRPDHLFLGTQQDNLTDMVVKGRSSAGERNGQSKLTWDQVREARRLRAEEGIPVDTLAARFGVAKYPMWALLNGRTWKEPT